MLRSKKSIQVFLGICPVILGFAALYPDHYKCCRNCLKLWREEGCSALKYPLDYFVVGTWLIIIFYSVVFVLFESQKEREAKFFVANQAETDRKLITATEQIKELNKLQIANDEFQQKELQYQRSNIENLNHLLTNQLKLKILEEDLARHNEGIDSEMVIGPNFYVFKEATIHFSRCFKLFQELLYPFEQGFNKPEFDNIDNIPKCINMILTATRLLAESFFRVEKGKLGINLMIYIDVEDGISDEIDNMLHSEHMLFARRQHRDNLLGFLYLHPFFNLPIKKKKGSLSIPIYLRSAGVYSDDNFKQNKLITLPGAPQAFQAKFSVIGNTHDDPYHYLNSESRNDMFKYFQGMGKHTCSLLSIKLPHSMGVLNIESLKSNTFVNNINYLETFDAMIHPVYELVSSYIVQYKEYIITTLRKQKY